MKCPCGDTVEFDLALWHFRNQHPDIISYNQAVVENPGYCKLLTRLILANDVPFMVYILCERKAEIMVGVYCLQEVLETYEVQVKLTTNSNNCTITLPNKKISKFRLRENCADCLLKTCNVKYHKYYGSNQNLIISNVYEMMNVRMNALSDLNVLNSDDIILTVDIVEETGTVNREVALSRNEQVRKPWECQICREYLVGPIFICPTGHSLCGSCKTKLSNCPYCVLVIGDSRNFTLEGMAECAEIVCQYEGRGCNFVGNVECIAKHERKCLWNEGELPSGKKKIRFSV